jgi:hypothetical protein
MPVEHPGQWLHGGLFNLIVDDLFGREVVYAVTVAPRCVNIWSRGVLWLTVKCGTCFSGAYGTIFRYCTEKTAKR